MLTETLTSSILIQQICWRQKSSNLGKNLMLRRSCRQSGGEQGMCQDERIHVNGLAFSCPCPFNAGGCVLDVVVVVNNMAIAKMIFNMHSIFDCCTFFHTFFLPELVNLLSYLKAECSVSCHDHHYLF